jgi:hypothetical protein
VDSSLASRLKQLPPACLNLRWIDRLSPQLKVEFLDVREKFWKGEFPTQNRTSLARALVKEMPFVVNINRIVEWLNESREQDQG